MLTRRLTTAKRRTQRLSPPRGGGAAELREPMGSVMARLWRAYVWLVLLGLWSVFGQRMLKLGLTQVIVIWYPENIHQRCRSVRTGEPFS